MGNYPAEGESNSEQAPSDNVLNNGESAEANSATTEGEGEISSAEVSPPHSAPDEPAGEGASQAEPVTSLVADEGLDQQLDYCPNSSPRLPSCLPIYIIGDPINHI
ncbi:unnamed protein product [Pleuronectes platessa]|uniref:Uncharacterized protein n=1 Tax=Pleuronectes platessa TaxID=8262 RepID=A0A9N7Z2M7_PLEPL|nr:unnamed protein product [Pleuronectes platessa]